MALYVAPDTDISPIICKVQIVGIIMSATWKERKLGDNIYHKQKDYVSDSLRSIPNPGRRGKFYVPEYETPGSIYVLHELLNNIISINIVKDFKFNFIWFAI